MIVKMDVLIDEEVTHSLLLSRKKHMDILGKMGVMPVSVRKSIVGHDYEQVRYF